MKPNVLLFSMIMMRMSLYVFPLGQSDVTRQDKENSNDETSRETTYLDTCPL